MEDITSVEPLDEAELDFEGALRLLHWMNLSDNAA